MAVVVVVVGVVVIWHVAAAASELPRRQNVPVLSVAASRVRMVVLLLLLLLRNNGRVRPDRHGTQTDRRQTMSLPVHLSQIFLRQINVVRHFDCAHQLWMLHLVGGDWNSAVTSRTSELSSQYAP